MLRHLVHLAIHTVQILHGVFNHVGRVLGRFTLHIARSALPPLVTS